MTYSGRVPLDDSYDVVVAGGGPAGCAAAAAAAREGCRTLLLEATGMLGGTGTAGLVTIWAPYSDKQGKVIFGGIAEDILDFTRKATVHIGRNRLDWVMFNPEHIKRAFDDLVEHAGARVLFNTVVAAVEMDGPRRVGAVLAGSKAGLKAYRAKIYVDCTGDGDLAAWAGAPYEKGDPGTGEMQPVNLGFLMTNIDEYAYINGHRINSSNQKCCLYDILKSGRYPEIVDPHCCTELIAPRTAHFNAGHIWDVDGTDPESVSKALMQGRRIAHAYERAFAEFHPRAFANACVIATGAILGVRETRRITGDYVLTVDDYAARRTFPDEIARNNYWIDIHTAKGEIESSVEGCDHVTSRFEHYGPGESYGIPYRCLTPEGLDNVLVAGRCVSCDRPVQGSLRVMPCCMTTGEAAGTAAARCLQAGGGSVHSVDTGALRETLKERGAYLP
ncbi:MAG: FAD-dependent oxidoreductase [Planctomycetes bacterium]|nr:FAD-dependent oxidoreductase [Planctomycetota bacterium]